MTDARYLRAKAQTYLNRAERAGKLEAFALRALAPECNLDAEKTQEETEDVLHKTEATNDREGRSPSWPSHREVCLNCNRDMLPIFRDGGSKFPEPMGFQCRPCGVTVIGGII